MESYSDYFTGEYASYLKEHGVWGVAFIWVAFIELSAEWLGRSRQLLEGRGKEGGWATSTCFSIFNQVSRWQTP